VINTSEVRFAIKGKMILMGIGRFVTLTRFIGQSVQPENEKDKLFKHQLEHLRLQSRAKAFETPSIHAGTTKQP
jgi:hypothetical protein